MKKRLLLLLLLVFVIGCSNCEDTCQKECNSFGWDCIEGECQCYHEGNPNLGPEADLDQELDELEPVEEIEDENPELVKLRELEAEIDDLNAKEIIVEREYYNELAAKLDNIDVEGDIWSPVRRKLDQVRDRVYQQEMLEQQQEQEENQEEEENPEENNHEEEQENNDNDGEEEQNRDDETQAEPVLLSLAHFGFNLDYYNPETGYAGDFYFAENVPEDRIFTPTGHNLDGGKMLPYPGYHLPIGTEIKSPIDGVVTAVEKNDNADDYEVHLQESESSSWIVAFDHLLDVELQEGDTVVVNQVLGTVPPWGSHDVGMTELEFFLGGNPPVAYCPFNFLREDLKEEFEAKMNDLIDKWEEFKGDDSLYDEDSWSSPWCVRDSISD